jgi:hypothetical protein
VKEIRVLSIRINDPQGFLAGLGALKCLAGFEGIHSARLGWGKEDEARLCWQGSDAPETAALVDAVTFDIGETLHSIRRLEELGVSDSAVETSIWRNCVETLSTDSDFRTLELLLALSVEAEEGTDGCKTQATRFHFLSGQQKMLSTAEKIGRRIDAKMLSKCLLEDGGKLIQMGSFRWSHSYFSEHAYVAGDPSEPKNSPDIDPVLEWLAFRGITMFRTELEAKRIRAKTACFDANFAPILTWPKWTEPLSENAIKPLLGFDWRKVAAAEREMRGVDAVFTATSRKTGKGYWAFEGALRL